MKFVRLSAWITLVPVLFMPRAFALTHFSPTGLSSASAASVIQLIKGAAHATDHRPYMPATSLGLDFGLDLGVEVSAVDLNSEFKSALGAAASLATDGSPDWFLIPKLSAHKGLPVGIDVGLSFISMVDLRSYGGDIKWAFLRSKKWPAMALEFSTNYSKFYFMTTQVHSVTLSVSKRLRMIEPYLGGGARFWSGSLAIPNSLEGLPLGVSDSASGISPVVFVGLSLKVFLLKMTALTDYTPTQGVNYGLKTAILF